eukprot:gene1584-25618_t
MLFRVPNAVPPPQRAAGGGWAAAVKPQHLGEGTLVRDILAAADERG